MRALNELPTFCEQYGGNGQWTYISNNTSIDNSSPTALNVRNPMRQAVPSLWQCVKVATRQSGCDGPTRVSRIHFTSGKEVYNLLLYKRPLFRRSKAKERRRG
jgi:hypothetical protein